MLKKSVYLFQVNFRYGNTVHLPYAAGCLEAYAKSFTEINRAFDFKDIVFIREDIDKVLENVINPSVAAFSAYIWNCEYDKVLAKRIKEKYPECIVIFGGHHVPDGSDMLRDNPFIDYLIHGEGEVPFAELLKGISGNTDIEKISGVSYRKGEKLFTVPEVTADKADFPSPYLSGCFDNIIKEYRSMDFMGLIETSRGCPYHCAYCDWSSAKSKLRKFPMEKIKREIEWISENKILGLGGGDANFGIFDRDEEITDWIVAAKERSGYPEAFQTSYEKNSSARVFRIGQKLEKARMNKGITLSFQSLDETALKNIGRENITVDSYSELMRMYNKAGIATYTELIVGLPGETARSFTDSIEKLLELGQHTCIYVHDCEWLPCSGMGKSEFIKKFGIKTSLVPLNQPHRGINEGDAIEEYSHIVTKTYSMTHEDWIQLNMLSYTVQCFHHMGLLKFIAIYLFNESGIKYVDFYKSFMDFMKRETGTVCAEAYNTVEKKIRDIAEGRGGSLVFSDLAFGDILWSGEEYMCLENTFRLDSFYKQTEPFIMSFAKSGEEELLSQLISFQRDMVRRPFEKYKEIKSDYDFYSYMKNFLSGEYSRLKKKKSIVKISSRTIESWEDYAKYIVWFGRRDNRNLYMYEAEAES